MSTYTLNKASIPAPDLSASEVEASDPSLKGDLASLSRNTLCNPRNFDQLFLERHGLSYVADYFASTGDECRVVTHPSGTSTCFEKAELLGWNPLNVIKCMYFENPQNGDLFAIVVPETGCFLDRDHIGGLLGLPDHTLRKASRLPSQMEPGTCSPFVLLEDIERSPGAVRRILFDTETLVMKRHERALDDFSFGRDHRYSIQMNYHRAYDLLRRRYPTVVGDEDILTLAFKEAFVRTQGKLKVSYEFKSLSYRVATFINNIHGHSDVSIINDHVDELELPDVLTRPRRGDGDD